MIHANEVWVMAMMMCSQNKQVLLLLSAFHKLLFFASDCSGDSLLSQYEISSPLCWCISSHHRGYLRRTRRFLGVFWRWITGTIVRPFFCLPLFLGEFRSFFLCESFIHTTVILVCSLDVNLVLRGWYCDSVANSSSAARRDWWIAAEFTNT